MFLPQSVQQSPLVRRRFVVLDRDGTINVDRHYLSDPAQLELLPAAAEGLRQMQAIGLGLIVITNQSGIGRGVFDWVHLNFIHRRLCDLLREEGVYLEGIYVCPHRPDDQCDCRKPKTGLLKRAAHEKGFALADCFVIGDKAADIELGQSVGAVTFLVRTKYRPQLAPEGTILPNYVVDDVQEAAQVVHYLLSAHERYRPNDHP
jgi:D-glycero-D-manno-heptose 1,7-bisphosphate phosphatase